MKLRWTAGVIAAVLLLLAAWLTRSEPVSLATSAPQLAEPKVETPPLPALPARAPPPAVVAQPVAELAARALASAPTTVQTQLSLLGDNQYELFVQTFTGEVRPQVTREVFDACRVRISQVPVRPDWEMAEESSGAGRRIVSVSMFGKSLTPFEETDGRWLAGALWCVPVGLP